MPTWGLRTLLSPSALSAVQEVWGTTSTLQSKSWRYIFCGIIDRHKISVLQCADINLVESANRSIDQINNTIPLVRQEKIRGFLGRKVQSEEKGRDGKHIAFPHRHTASIRTGFNCASGQNSLRYCTVPPHHTPWNCWIVEFEFSSDSECSLSDHHFFSGPERPFGQIWGLAKDWRRIGERIRRDLSSQDRPAHAGQMFFRQNSQKLIFTKICNGEISKISLKISLSRWWRPRNTYNLQTNSEIIGWGGGGCQGSTDRSGQSLSPKFSGHCV